jgi:CheY-like chemotaxis protein
VPFLFVTGYAREGIPAAFAAVPVVSKPYQSPALAAALDAVFARRAV